MHSNTLFVIVLFLLSSAFVVTASASCSEDTYHGGVADLPPLKRVTRLALSGPIAALNVYSTLTGGQLKPILASNGDNLVLHSSVAGLPSWVHIDLLSSQISIKPVFAEHSPESVTIHLTSCEVDTEPLSFSDSMFTVETSKARLVSMYENELTVMFRTFRSGLFFFSMADQGDVLVAQIVHGTVYIIFDFGSLTQSEVSGGRALDDGEWHEARWVHQFDSVQLSVDGVLLNHTTPSGLYRKLDLHTQIHIAGRPPDDFSPSIQSSFTGCLARVQLNSVNLLTFASKEHTSKCQLSRPPSITLLTGSRAIIPFSFLPFSFEIRTIDQPATLLTLADKDNNTLLKVTLEDGKTLHLVSNMTKFKQIAHPPVRVGDSGWHSISLRIRGVRLEVDVDGYTVLWIEGIEVRRISARLAYLVLEAAGCYRSTTIDFHSVITEGNVKRDSCQFIDKCEPNPCENGGTCASISLSEYKCFCKRGYSGKHCHTSEHYRSCEEYFFFRDKKFKRVETKRDTRLRNVTVDADGGGRLQPFILQCKRQLVDGNLEVTSILPHDLSTPLIVTGDHPPGTVKKMLDYRLGNEELDVLVEGFQSCQQFMSYGCRGGVRLMTFGDERTPSSWYATRNEKHGLQWGEAPPYSRMCGCAVNSTCIHNRMCNCDSGEDGRDEGINQYSQLLPITALFLGGTTVHSALNVSIGPLICKSKVIFEPVTFTSRDARVTGTKTVSGRTVDLLLHIKFTHSNLAVFTWESIDSLHWMHLRVDDGRIVGEVVTGGRSEIIASKSEYNDGEWHSVYWEVDNRGMRLSVDGTTVQREASIVLPTPFQWTVGSRHSRGSVGFAGVLRNVYLCGEELQLATMVKRDHGTGIVTGEKGECRENACANGGRCVDGYDSFTCDCSLTPFGGADCTREYGVWIPLNSSLEIPWQNPAHQAFCHRLAIQTTSVNVSLLRGKALFSEAKFNLSINPQGHIDLWAWDGFFFTHRKSDKTVLLNDNLLHDISFCADKQSFTLNIDEDVTLKIDGNWTFFGSLNVWDIVDSNFTGCLSRLRVGNSFPLKSAKSSRLKYTAQLGFGMCSPTYLEQRIEETTNNPFDKLSISPVAYSTTTLLSITTIGAAILGGVLLLSLCVLICYMRSRPEGVYKTNEGVEQYSPSRSEEPLVHSHMTNSTNKEYFC